MELRVNLRRCRPPQPKESTSYCSLAAPTDSQYLPIGKFMGSGARFHRLAHHLHDLAVGVVQASPEQGISHPEVPRVTRRTSSEVMSCAYPPPAVVPPPAENRRYRPLDKSRHKRPHTFLRKARGPNSRPGGPVTLALERCIAPLALPPGNCIAQVGTSSGDLPPHGRIETRPGSGTDPRAVQAPTSSRPSLVRHSAARLT